MVHCIAGMQPAHLATALSGALPSPGSTASAWSTITATIWPPLRKRRTTCSSTGQMFIPYPLLWQGPAWSLMLVSCLKHLQHNNRQNIHTLIADCIPQTMFKQQGMKMVKQPEAQSKGIVQENIKLIQGPRMWTPSQGTSNSKNRNVIRLSVPVKTIQGFRGVP